ncbi:DUF962 domain-containing protein [Leptospira bouyouniensis]|uniref:DUF962 domain-containing protein n=1 Tax=Leptospira bouyouniensis TaxID=2484911 RepID=A0A7I0HPR7_9LEPT|nr:Mpo1-like protein [Leptospira bouyouniensis]TGL03463.1 DUF962 domain-containing protein [Leptospira bouyouniensis]
MRFAKEMAFYSAYHQEKRNVWIHVLGVPTITFTLFVVLSRFSLFEWNGFNVSASLVFTLAILGYYFTLDVVFALVATLLFGGLFVTAERITAQLPSQTAWTIFGLGQVIGWGSQFYGHFVFEKSRPALFDNLFQALVSAPLFVVADVFFELGYRLDLKIAVDDELKQKGVWKDFSVQKTA